MIIKVDVEVESLPGISKLKIEKIRCNCRFAHLWQRGYASDLPPFLAE